MNAQAHILTGANAVLAAKNAELIELVVAMQRDFQKIARAADFEIESRGDQPNLRRIRAIAAARFE